MSSSIGTAASGQARRWTPDVRTFVLLASLGNALLYHWPLYRFALANLDLRSFGGLLTLLTTFFLLTFFSALVLSLVALVAPRLLKPVCLIAACGNALALYFVQSYGVVLDKSMLGNVLDTDVAESLSFLSPRLFVYLAIIGLLPAWLLARLRLQPASFARRSGLAAAILAVGVGWIYASAQTWPWFDEHSSRLGGLTMPWSYVIGTARNLSDKLQSRAPRPLPAAHFLSKEPVVVALVIGESARAQNFSLYGYPRDTNPQLEAARVAVLAHTRACATYTTAAVACILSPAQTGRFSAAEPLPSYLARSGVDVIWRANNWGEPPLRVQSYLRAEDLRRSCRGEACHYDEILLQGLEQQIRASPDSKVFVVLHLHGSHGPAYYTAYPPAFETFTPVCRSVQLHECTHESLVNAYDNTIVYTDDLLGRVIRLLQSLPQARSMMMYIGDHGESLGEYGLYLHGTPYALSPDVQKDVPFLVWMSQAFVQAHAVTPAQLARQREHSQANVFHSIMGALDLRSAAYDAGLDVFNRESAAAVPAVRTPARPAAHTNAER